ncbi:hypothetical protein FNH22_17735 [Fulvivirga sp. M361]|uniref:SRPBCC family protein n=1 Tax=Fulvivirga sp. M361 TaxID=2594266 RepID=UPI00117A4AE5|nr:hypothetical protein [Fulvivirga sp. M361]TRX56003.1 hypothetical protein FNH22_17735 [Fulvivirga sp. M361]
MRLKISSKVLCNYLEVKNGFTEKLFLKLNPPFPPVKLLVFEGCNKGDRVSLELNFLLFKQTWTSLITFDHSDSSVFEFIDVGKKLPFFLKSWEHHHSVIRLNDTESEIVDDISFTTPYKMLDWLLLPALWLQFMYRKPIYKKIFKCH